MTFKIICLNFKSLHDASVGTSLLNIWLINLMLMHWMIFWNIKEAQILSRRQWKILKTGPFCWKMAGWSHLFIKHAMHSLYKEAKWDLFQIVLYSSQAQKRVVLKVKSKIAICLKSSHFSPHRLACLQKAAGPFFSKSEMTEHWIIDR